MGGRIWLAEMWRVLLTRNSNVAADLTIIGYPFTMSFMRRSSKKDQRPQEFLDAIQKRLNAPMRTVRRLVSQSQEFNDDIESVYDVFDGDGICYNADDIDLQTGRSETIDLSTSSSDTDGTDEQDNLSIDLTSSDSESEEEEILSSNRQKRKRRTTDPIDLSASDSDCNDEHDPQTTFRKKKNDLTATASDFDSEKDHKPKNTR